MSNMLTLCSIKKVRFNLTLPYLACCKGVPPTTTILASTATASAWLAGLTILIYTFNCSEQRCKKRKAENKHMLHL